MRAPRWLALTGDGYVPETRAEIIIPEVTAADSAIVNLNIQENSAGYYLSQTMSYHMKSGAMNSYAAYTADLVYLEWDPDEDVFSLFWDASGGKPSETQWGTVFNRVSMEQVMYGARLADSTDAMEMIFIDRQWRSVLDGPYTLVELNTTMPVSKGYAGLAKLKEVNGEWYVEATGDRVEISNGTLLTDDNSIRSSVIGQRFISAYNAYAAQEGLSTKEQADQTGGSQSDGMSPLIPQGDTEGY